MLFHRSFLWKGCRFGGAICHVDVTFCGILATSAIISFYILLGLYRIFDYLRQTKTCDQYYKLLTIHGTSNAISYPFTSKSHHFSWWEASGRSSRIQGRSLELLGRHTSQDRLPSALALSAFLAQEEK